MSWRAAGRAAQGSRRPPPKSLVRRVLDGALIVTLLFLVAVISARLDRVATRRLSGEVAVNDGDSLTLKGERIRLKGIDAPEYAQTCEKDGERYPCGRRSREALAGLAAKGPVECVGWERDRYGRLLAVCAAGGVDLNRTQVEQGWAVAFGDYDDLEALARAKRRGLWAGSFERPREWRIEHGAMTETEHDLMSRMLNWLTSIFGLS